MRKKEKFIKKWEKKRQNGKKKYILTNCIMMGTATLVGSVIGRYLSGNSMYSYLEYHIYIDFGYFIGGFIGAGLGSILKWNKNEEKYEILTKSK